MTVMVTGASGVVGRAVVKALLARDEVRATVRRPETAEGLRALGAKVSVRAIDDEGALAEILPRCHTLIHLIGGPDQPDADELFRGNHGSVLTALRAAHEEKVRRFVLLSIPNADPEATHPYLRAKGLAEEAVRSSDLEYAILRATHVYGLGGLWFTAAVEGALVEPPFVAGPGTQEVAPLFADDLGAAVAAIDDVAGEIAGTWGLEGPDVVTADGFCRLLRGDDVEPDPRRRSGRGGSAHPSPRRPHRRRGRVLPLDGEPGRRPRRRRGVRRRDDAVARWSARHPPDRRAARRWIGCCHG